MGSLHRSVSDLNEAMDDVTRLRKTLVALKKATAY